MARDLWVTLGDKFMQQCLAKCSPLKHQLLTIKQVLIVMNGLLPEYHKFITTKDNRGGSPPTFAELRSKLMAQEKRLQQHNIPTQSNLAQNMAMVTVNSYYLNQGRGNSNSYCGGRFGRGGGWRQWRRQI